MSWPLLLLLLIVPLTILMFSGLPVAFSFALVNIVGLPLYFGSLNSLSLLAGSAFEAGSQFTLTAIPMFILMGDLLMRTGFGMSIVEAADQWIGRVPGRLALTAVGGGVLFGAVSGSTMASVSVLGTLLIAQMEARRYKPQMTVGPILAAAGLDALIPPSALAVLLGAIAKVSISELLIAGILPGLLLAVLYAAYFVGRAMLQPDLAPKYDAPAVSLAERLKTLARLSPLILIMLVVTGFIFLGIATPTETAALGVVCSALMALAYGKLTLDILWRSLLGTARITAMIMLIIVGAAAYGQLLAATGAAQGMIDWTLGQELTPLQVVLLMQVIIFLLGTFLDTVPIMMITVPLFYPIIKALGLDEIWFSVLFLIQMQLAGITPPHGVLLFVLNGIRPDIPLKHIYGAVLPIVLIQFVVIAAIIVWPEIATYLPSLIFD